MNETASGMALVSLFVRLFSTSAKLLRVTGAPLKLEATKSAETESRAIANDSWSAEARVELFWRFIMYFPSGKGTSTSKPDGLENARVGGSDLVNYIR